MPSARRRSEPRYLSRAEADTLLAELTKDMRPIVATMLFAGLRVSEALGLTWNEVDLAEAPSTSTASSAGTARAWCR
jgi:integrase